MKKVFQLSLFLILILNFSGCGYQNTLRTHCHLGTQMCDTLFGRNTYEEIDSLATRVAQTQKEVESLKTMIDSMITSAQSLAAQFASNAALMEVLKTQISDHSDTFQLLVDTNQTLAQKLTYQEQLIAAHEAELYALASQDSIIEFQDPCGTKAGHYNEVLMKTKSGKYICYFEKGGNRFLTQLVPGSYQTTDGTKCYFDISPQGVITNERY